MPPGFVVVQAPAKLNLFLEVLGKCTESSDGIHSFHPGGSYVVMCGDTVHFLSENIAQRTFGFMITRETGEPLSQFTAPYFGKRFCEPARY